MKEPPPPTWFFSPPAGPSIDPASLDVIIHHIRQGDEHWSVEAPATADDYCRENFAPLTWSNREEGFPSVSATIYYIDRGRFTVAVSGTGITDKSQAVDPQTGLRIPYDLFDMYPVAGTDWENFLTVSRQDELYRYPLAVTVDRDRLTEIVRHLYETRTLWPGCEWFSELEYFRRHGQRFYVPDV